MNSSSPARQSPYRTRQSSPTLFSVVALTLLLGAASTSRADGTSVPGPQEVVENISKRIAAGVIEQGEIPREGPGRQIQLMEEVTAQNTDFAHMARLVLGSGWARATPDQQRQFVAAFRAFLIRTFAHHVADHAGARTVVSAPRTSASGRIALVRSVVRPVSGQKTDMDYRLRIVDGRWKLFDVSISGVSLITIYRSSFATKIATLGLDGLIEQLTTQNQQLQDT